jgi:hypothetical protein
LFIGKEETDRLEEKSKEIQRLKRTINKLQKENVTLKRDKRVASKPEVEQVNKNYRKRNTLYVPSTQKIGLNKKRKQSKDEVTVEGFEPDENMMDVIENNIFSKITESVDKIFNLQNFDARSTFSGYKMNAQGLDIDDTFARMTIANKPARRDSFEDRLQEIAELEEEDERDNRRSNM